MESSPETAVKKDKVIFAEVASSSATTAPTTDSPPVRESPFSNYANNLSPINTVKGAHVAQGFLGLNSPPLVFASPSISIQRESNLVKRTMLKQLSNEELPQRSSEFKEVLKAPDGFKECQARVSNNSPTHSKEVLVAKDSMDVQPCISPGCVKEYLADPAEMECENSSYLVSPLSNKLDDGLQGCIPCSVGNITALCSKEELDGCLGTVDIGPLYNSQQSNGTSVNTEEKQWHNKCLSEEHPNDKLNFSEDSSLEKTQCEDSSNQTAGGEHLVACNMRPICPETFPVSLSHEGHGKDGYDSLALQQQRGFLRRCLQFDEVQTDFSRKNISKYLANKSTSSGIVATTTEVDETDLHCSNSTLGVNQSPHAAFLVPSNHSEDSSPKPCKSSGILHLNSIVSTGQASQSASSTTKLVDCPQSHNLKDMGTETHHTLTELDICSMPPCTGEKVFSSSEERRHDNVSTAQDHVNSVSCCDLEQLDQVKSIEQQATPLHKRKLSEEHADNLEELDQMTPTKKWKKASASFHNEGCKRCNCKKSQCLKLYCDCFAAGMYCTEPCTCQGCFNKPKCEVMVLEARHQIESRNPLAFAPKIVQNAKDNLAKNGEDGSRHTPSSARHKRGCNCKKSMCQKKYCECYQANVGCSDNCRCEGCKNVYGRKEDYGMPKEIRPGICYGSVQAANDEKLAIPGTKKDYTQEIYCPGNMTPLTPSLQCSDHGKGPPRSRIISSMHIISPDLALTVPSSSAKSIRPEKGSRSIKKLPDGTKEALEVGSVFQVSDDMDMVDELFPRPGSLVNSCHQNLPQSSPLMACSSSSLPTAAEQTHSSHISLCPGSGEAQTSHSLHWRSSLMSLTQLRGTKSQMDVKSDMKLHDCLEDDTPDILKDTSTPTTSVKNNSPNRKRVSPPHSHTHVIGSTSSAGKKISRKFILRAVPSFPPLTPCISREGSPNEKSDFQDRGRNCD